MRNQMKKTLLTGIAALFLATGATGATSVGYVAHYPPAKYDVPYKGTLTIQLVFSFNDLQYYCHTSEIACSDVYTNRCNIYILAPEARPIMYGGEGGYFFSLRHELAHCNGWDAEHTGGTLLPANTQVERPKLPPSTRWTPEHNDNLFDGAPREGE
jgi:hypothetical protein